jgi:hypothetical protein
MHAVTGVPVVAGFYTNKSVLDLVCVLILLKVPVPFLVMLAGGFFCMYIISHCQLSDSDLLEDAGIKPRTVWDWQSDALTTRIDLIHSRLCSSHPLLG